MAENLLRDAGINDKARKVTLRRNQVIVPLKFDEDGEPATLNKLVFKRLSLDDLRFLALWRKADWNIEQAISNSGLSQERANRLIGKLAYFRKEDARVKALCEIPTPSWIAAKHVQNVYEGGTLEDSAQKSLQELAKIEGAYKTTASLNITQNVFNLPQLAPGVEEQLKELAEKAIDAEITSAA